MVFFRYICAMKRFFAIFCAILYTISSADARNLDRVLCKVYNIDQSVRKELITAQRSGDITRLISAAKRLEKCDERNQKIVFNILDKHGWPNNLSEQALKAIWLVVQHSDLKNIEKYLPSLKEGSQKGEISQIDIATMEDRLKVYKSETQIYGSQTIMIGDTIYLYPVYEPDRLDIRRAQIGMSLISEYITTLEKLYNKTVIFDKNITFEEITNLQKQQRK